MSADKAGLTRKRLDGRWSECELGSELMAIAGCKSQQGERYHGNVVCWV